MAPNGKDTKQLAVNRKARHEYFIEETYEAGIELFGTEVKSIRLGGVNFKDAYCAVKNGEMFIYNMHVSPYEKGNIFNRDPMRPRRLLLHKREIMKLFGRVRLDGMTIVPLSLYLRGSLVKAEIGLARGKKLHDKRDAAAERSAKRDIDRAIKEKNAT